MKKIFFLVLLICNEIAFANNDSYNKLVDVNKCWTEQKDINFGSFEVLDAATDKEWIKLHLMLVEQILRARSTKNLNNAQQINRAQCLEILHRYWQEGNFPINDQYAYRTPIFIDPYNNFCAVGFLIKETGYEPIARMIASKTNLAYVREMNYPELGNWAIENGFSIDELAWIQPGYGTVNTSCGKIGNGVDGFVKELFVDTTMQQLYVGGKFIQADISFVANNIAYVTENAGVYTWHKMGNGVNGQVNAITKFDGKIFVAGAFDSVSGIETKNIAYWDGSTWQSAGCIDGVVNDLTVFEGVLYAAGNFKSCGTEMGNNFAQWNGTKWTMIQGIEGKINTLEGFKDYLVLGGKFDYDTALNVNAIKWNPTKSFQQFDNKINNEVMDFEVFADTLYVSCKSTSKIDSSKILQRLIVDKWKGHSFIELGNSFFKADNDALSFNTLCSYEANLFIGGNFLEFPMIGNNSKYSTSILKGTVVVDSAINKIVIFKKEAIYAGKFKYGQVCDSKGNKSGVELNGITKQVSNPTSISENPLNTTSLKIYPNPVQSGKIIHIDNSFFATEYSITTVDGKQCNKGKVGNKNEIQLPQLASGIYFIELQNASGKTALSKIIVE